jgi:hypothetical protein
LGLPEKYYLVGRNRPRLPVSRFWTGANILLKVNNSAGNAPQGATHMKKATIGCFVFKDEGDGCLTAKWNNDVVPDPQSEACKLINGASKGVQFIGTYKTVWTEGNSAHDCQLDITPHPKDPNQFAIRWYDVKHGIDKFHGVGMLCGGMLIGAYWD